MKIRKPHWHSNKWPIEPGIFVVQTTSGTIALRISKYVDDDGHHRLEATDDMDGVVFDTKDTKPLEQWLGTIEAYYGPIPPRRIRKRLVNSAVRVPRLHRGSRGFESLTDH